MNQVLRLFPAFAAGNLQGISRRSPREQIRQLVLDEPLHLRRPEDLNKGPQAPIICPFRPGDETQHETIIDRSADDQRSLRIATKS